MDLFCITVIIIAAVLLIIGAIVCSGDHTYPPPPPPIYERVVQNVQLPQPPANNQIYQDMNEDVWQAQNQINFAQINQFEQGDFDEIPDYNED